MGCLAWLERLATRAVCGWRIATSGFALVAVTDSGAAGTSRSGKVARHVPVGRRRAGRGGGGLEGQWTPVLLLRGGHACGLDRDWGWVSCGQVGAVLDVPQT